MVIYVGSLEKAWCATCSFQVSTTQGRDWFVTVYIRLTWNEGFWMSKIGKELEIYVLVRAVSAKDCKYGASLGLNG
jgi:hypothetical protein